MKRKAARKQETRWPEKTDRRSMELEPGLFGRSAKVIASSIKRAAEESREIKGTPRQSAIAVINFVLNRSGRNMAPERRKRLERAKDELRRLFDREEARG